MRPLSLYTVVLVLTVSAHAQTASIVGFEMIPSEVQKTYAVTNVAVTLAPSRAQWSAVAFINNLDDKRPYGSAYYDSTMGVIGASASVAKLAPIAARLLPAIWEALWAAFFATLLAATYHDLRVVKEGIDLEGLPAVFD